MCFQTDEAFYNFLENLHQFYDDTHAAAFFERSAIHRQLEQHIQSGMAGVPVITYFNAAESYTGTKDKLFPQQTCITPHAFPYTNPGIMLPSTRFLSMGTCIF